MPSVEHAIIADNAAAVAAAAGRLTELGFTVAAPVTGVVGEARDRAFEFVAAARTARARAGSPGPVALVWGGETVVTVKGNGRGGRNLEAALAAAIMLDGEPAMTVATFATDGVDGAADAAGAIVDGRTAALARRGGRDPEAFLAANDSLGFFEGGHELLAPGPTGTNVNDVWIALAY
jgi:glycerate-2-kinase